LQENFSDFCERFGEVTIFLVLQKKFQNREFLLVGLSPGNSKSLWSAVKCAKDLNHSGLPTTMMESGVEIPEENLSNKFTYYFDKYI
jgi:hypothetical protein